MDVLVQYIIEAQANILKRNIFTVEKSYFLMNKGDMGVRTSMELANNGI